MTSKPLDKKNNELMNMSFDLHDQTNNFYNGQLQGEICYNNYMDKKDKDEYIGLRRDSVDSFNSICIKQEPFDCRNRGYKIGLN